MALAAWGCPWQPRGLRLGPARAHPTPQSHLNPIQAAPAGYFQGTTGELPRNYGGTSKEGTSLEVYFSYFKWGFPIIMVNQGTTKVLPRNYQGTTKELPRNYQGGTPGGPLGTPWLELPGAAWGWLGMVWVGWVAPGAKTTPKHAA